MSSFAELPAGLPALDRPALSLPVALRGHVVAVLFWRVGCVHGRQALADLCALAAELAGQPYAVLGVHVPVLAAERDRGRVRRAVAELDLAATVLFDDDRAFTRALGVKSLPTLALFDALGDACFVGVGEPNRAKVRAAVETLLAMAEERGLAARVPFAPPARPVGRALRPTALTAAGDRLWVGAAGHGRAYLVGPDGAVERSLDGVEAPAGMCVHDRRLLVSEARCHEVRAFDLDLDDGGCGGAGWTTLFGTGYRSSDRFGGSFGTDQGLCSPAGLLMHEGALYCAQAGAHQIWQLDPDTGAASFWIGTGAQRLCDGATAAAFAEPRALAVASGQLFVADAGNDALRRVDLATTTADTVARDLQRPVAVAAHGERLLVLAAWQPALLAVPADGGAPETRFTADDGLVDPAALALVGERLWIADPGADCLFVADLAAPAPRLRRVDVTGWSPLEAPAPQRGAARVAVPITVQEHGDVALRVPLPAAGHGGGVDCEVDVVDEGEPVLAAECHDVVRAESDHVVVRVPVGARGRGTWRVQVKDGDQRHCHLVEVEASSDGPMEVALASPPPEPSS